MPINIYHKLKSHFILFNPPSKVIKGLLVQKESRLPASFNKVNQSYIYTALQYLIKNPNVTTQQ